MIQLCIPKQEHSQRSLHNLEDDITHNTTNHQYLLLFFGGGGVGDHINI